MFALILVFIFKFCQIVLHIASFPPCAIIEKNSHIYKYFWSHNDTGFVNNHQIITYIIFHFNQIGGFWNEKFIIVFIVSPSNLCMVQFVCKIMSVRAWCVCIASLFTTTFYLYSSVYNMNLSFLLIKYSCCPGNAKWVAQIAQEKNDYPEHLITVSMFQDFGLLVLFCLFISGL